ncbi:MAG: twin-arginine translocase TatA/TatE family subunit [Halobacteriovoraceae bacterium]|nr:twin-arginine translocase TatA/TatE family subunit [Halobacteriovoraceae bacterium]
MFGLGAGEILIILVFALIFIGPKKLPELARNLGKGIREFQKAKDELTGELMTQVNDDPEHNHHNTLTGVQLDDKEVEKEMDAMKAALETTSKDSSDSQNETSEEKTEDPKTT